MDFEHVTELTVDAPTDRTYTPNHKNTTTHLPPPPAPLPLGSASVGECAIAVYAHARAETRACAGSVVGTRTGGLLVVVRVGPLFPDRKWDC